MSTDRLFLNRVSRWLALVVIVTSCSLGDDGVEPRFAALETDSVRDTRTGTVWSRSDGGLNLSWRDAKRHCDALVRSPNGKGWRLPTIDQLDTLYDPSNEQPCGEATTCRVDPMIDLSRPYVWSATAPQPNRRFYYDFSFGTRLAPLIRPTLLRGVLCTRS